MKLMKLTVIAMCLLFCGLSNADAETYPQLVARLDSTGMFQPVVEQLLLTKLNELRASKGLARLAVEGAFTGAARAHVMDMAQRNYLGHNSATGLDFSGRMKALQGGVMRYSAVGENAVMMYPPHGAAQVADTLFHSWLNSPPHLHNMLRSDFTSVATGAVILNGKAYADQIFVGAPLPPESLDPCKQTCVSWH
jgi:uncharacterized protein YkwD